MTALSLQSQASTSSVAPIRDVRLEKEIIVKEAQDLARAGHIDCPVDTDVAELLAVTYHELREGVTAEGTLVDRPAAVMSTAEAVSVYFQTLSHAWYYDDGRIDLRLLTENLLGAVCKENRDDLEKLKGYFHTAVKEKSAKEGGLWKAYYETGKFLK